MQRSDWCGKTSTPKSGKPRRIPLTKRLAEALLANRHLRGPRVLYRDGGEPLTKKVVRNWVATAQRRAGMAVDSKVHKLRHTFCSHLAMRGAPARAIQDLAGSHRPDDDAALHAPVAGGCGCCDSVARHRPGGTRPWRHSGDGGGGIKEVE